MHKIFFIITIIFLVLAFLRYFEWKNLYYPTRTLEYVPSDIQLRYEDIAFVAEDGCRLHGWWIPVEPSRGTIIICHGNAGNIGDRIWLAADLQRLGVNIFLFDYRGYGRSRGIPREKGLYRDARAAYEVVRARYEDAEEPPVLVYGRSLGGAVAVQLALDKPVKGLILESTFTSVIDMGKELYPFLPVEWLAHDRYDVLSKIDKVTVPVLVAHSPQDQLLPFSMSREIFAAVQTEKTFSELKGGHNESGWNSAPGYWRDLQRFVQDQLGSVPDSGSNTKTDSPQ